MWCIAGKFRGINSCTEALPQTLLISLTLYIYQDASEYNELPVRHNEDVMNTALAKKLPLPVSPPDSYDSPHSKAHLLLQAHFSHSDLPIADYQTDTKSVLDQALRILQVCVYTVRVDIII